MKIYLIGLAMGLAVGIFYGLLHIRSPAPPVVALLGLLGILIGEQVPPLVRHLFTETTARSSWHRQVRPHMFGQLPSGLSDPGESR
jgi:XapX domain-containing protein